MVVTVANPPPNCLCFNFDYFFTALHPRGMALTTTSVSGLLAIFPRDSFPTLAVTTTSLLSFQETVASLLLWPQQACYLSTRQLPHSCCGHNKLATFPRDSCLTLALATTSLLSFHETIVPLLLWPQQVFQAYYLSTRQLPHSGKTFAAVV